MENKDACWHSQRFSFSADDNILATASSRFVQLWDISKIAVIKEDELEEVYGFLKLMLDKLLNRQARTPALAGGAREEHKENPLNFALLAFFAVNFVWIANIVRL